MKVRELLSHPDKWTQGVMFRNRQGKQTHHVEEAHSYCLVGAIRACYKYEDAKSVFKKIQGIIGDRWPSQWNDSHSYEEVKSLVNELDI